MPPDAGTFPAGDPGAAARNGWSSTSATTTGCPTDRSPAYWGSAKRRSRSITTMRYETENQHGNYEPRIRKYRQAAAYDLPEIASKRCTNASAQYGGTARTRCPHPPALPGGGDRCRGSPLATASLLSDTSATAPRPRCRTSSEQMPATAPTETLQQAAAENYDDILYNQQL